ncbi:hypothetical protein BpHYR1_036730 [Brachionus plicatilis]|uniref:Uncharacterized protein n=1 Tax=Brachionus plicatilis TaxID=10195 RepID=A0A3M7RL45_BRAPC|nr:hypothetical protein BpHYR1_036730 [Brachionus plicatilis]
MNLNILLDLFMDAKMAPGCFIDSFYSDYYWSCDRSDYTRSKKCRTFTKNNQNYNNCDNYFIYYRS